MGNIRITKTGYLYFDFYYNKVRRKEYTRLKATRPNSNALTKDLKDDRSRNQSWDF